MKLAGHKRWFGEGYICALSLEGNPEYHGNRCSAKGCEPGAGTRFEPSEHLCWEWGLILNANLPLLPSCWGSSFALGCGVSFYGGIQHYPVNGCSAGSCNFGVLAGEDERMSFNSDTRVGGSTFLLFQVTLFQAL